MSLKGMSNWLGRLKDALVPNVLWRAKEARHTKVRHVHMDLYGDSYYYERRDLRNRAHTVQLDPTRIRFARRASAEVRRRS